MELESYFEFLSEDDIRIKGTRVGIETILDDYLEKASPEEIAVRYRSLSLEQVYATITYYLRNREKIDAYLEAERIKNHQRTAVAEDRTDYRPDETTVELESYFEFLSEEDIRIRGTRVGIETILEDYLEGNSPEEIATRYRSPSLEQVYATITYYLHNRTQMDAYLEAWRQYTDRAYQESKRDPSQVVKRLQRLKNTSTQTTS